MPKHLRATPLLFALPVALGVAAVVAAIALWQHVVVPFVETRMARATGHRTVIGTLIPRGRRLEAREVVIYGAPPFDGAPLARIGRLEITLGGGLLAPRATAIVVDDALFTYLGIGLGADAVDNLRGVPGSAAPGRAMTSSGAGASVELRGSRAEAFVRVAGLPENQGLVARSEAVTATRATDGRLDLEVTGVVLDVPGHLTVRVPRIVGKRAGDTLELAGHDVTAAVPAGGALLAPLSVTAQLTRGGGAAHSTASLRLSPGAADPAGAGTLSGELTFASGARPRGELHARKVPLAALASFAQRFGLALTRGSADVDLALAGESGTGRPIIGTLSVTTRDLDIHHARLDRVPWRGLALAARVRGSFDPAVGRLEIGEGELGALGVRAAIAGWLTRAPLAGELRVSPAPGVPSACAEALAAWPAAVRDKLTGLTVGGRIAPRARLAFDARHWEDLALEIAFDPLCSVTSEPAAIAKLVPASAARIAAALRPLGVAASDVVTTGELPAHVIGAFLTAEDAGFRRHGGLDPENIRRALAHDLAMGSLTKGASTLTQQLVKNLFLSPERTLARKLAELVLTWRIEQRLSKDQILALYLNVVELGPGIRGLGRAAQVYFGKPARALTPLEAAHLAALLPNPIGFARRFRDGRVDDGWMRKLYDLLARMRRSGLLPEAALEAARATPLSLRKL